MLMSSGAAANYKTGKQLQTLITLINLLTLPIMVDAATVALINDLFAWFLIAFWLFIWIGFLTSILLARIWICADRKNKPNLSSTTSTVKSSILADPLLPESTFPGITILKPLTGADEVLSHNLESWFKLRYPLFEILFCVHDVDDAAVPIVNNLIDKYPGVDAKLVISGAGSTFPSVRSNASMYKMPLSPMPSVDDVEKQKKSSSPPVAELSTVINPKIRNILPAYESSKYELVFISDCNIEAEPETLHDVVSWMGPRVGTVCQIHFVKDPPSNQVSFGSIVNKVFFGTQNAKALLFLALLRVTTTVSAAMLIRKSALDECGGLRAFGCYLAEDLHIGLALSKRGWSHKLGSRLAWQNPAKTSVQDVFNRVIRWKRLRQTTTPILVLVDPLSECIVLGLCASWALCHVFPTTLPFLTVFLAHCLAWFFADFLLLTTLNKEPLKFPKFAFLLAWLVRELSAPYIHILSLMSRRVNWRGQEYYLKLGGETVKLPPAKLPPKPPTQINQSFTVSAERKQQSHRKQRATSLTLTNLPIVELDSKSSTSERNTPIFNRRELLEIDLNEDYPNENQNVQIEKPKLSSPRRSDDTSINPPSSSSTRKSRRHQQQAPSPPSLSAINA